ncbi:MAG: hypothetical protein ISS35_08585 [Kiritimatiellae bacterium]|nr:hypothetical protein [Kiritimatiellia bacterium]
MNAGEKRNGTERGVSSDAANGVGVATPATRRDVLITALRAAPVVLLLTARGAQAQGSAASGAPSGG